MRFDQYLQNTVTKLIAAGIGTARLDALVLLEDCLSIDRAQLLAHPETELSAEHVSILDAQIKRRMNHEPLAYIRGKTEFYGRDFIVNKDVLEPRPESETMIDRLKTLPLGENPLIIDVGTGSGALAITAKLELPETTVIGIDIDSACLKVAKQNAAQLGAVVSWRQHDLLARLLNSTWDHGPDTSAYALLCNLPYVPDTFQINPAAGHEPRLAIFGGPDGLDLYRKLFQQLKSRAFQPDFILTECLPPQHQSLIKIAETHNYQQTAEDDFIQVFSLPGPVAE